MANRSTVPKWIKRVKGIKVGAYKKSLNPMKFSDARKKRPAQNKGRGHQGGWAAIKDHRSG